MHSISDENRKTKKIISLEIDLIGYQDAISNIIRLGKNRMPGYVCFTNVHMSIEAYKDATFSEQVNKAVMVLPDGMPIAKSIAFLYGQKQERIAGMDVFPDILRTVKKNGLKVFLLGSTPEVLGKIKDRIENECPGAPIAGSISPPFGAKLDSDNYVEQINRSGANLVFVSLGCPKQEKWMANNSQKINALLLGVGAAFPVYAEAIRRAPLFMQKIGLEWFYRLLQEPRRLFKRYMITNSLFIYLIAKIKIGQILGK